MSGLRAVQDQWNALLESSRAATVFLMWEWIWVWWQVYGGDSRLHVLVARAPDGTIVGVAPLQVVQRSVLGLGWRAVTFIGSGGDVTPEYLDFVVLKGWDTPVTDAFLAHLLADQSIDEIDLFPLAVHSPNLESIMRALARTRGGVQRLRGHRCPFLVLPDSTEAFRASRSRNYRKKMGEYRRRCERRKARLRRATTAAEAVCDLKTLAALHATRWKGESRAFRSREYVEFHQAFAPLMLERNGLRLFSLETDSHVLAMSYCLYVGGRYSFYQVGRDPAFSADRAGLVLMHQVIEEAIREKALVFDFLSGDEAYKYRWATAEGGSDRVVGWKGLSTRAASLSRRIALRGMGTLGSTTRSLLGRGRSS